MANTRILSKSAEYGIIRQGDTSVSTGAETAFKAAAGTTASWTNPAVAGTNYRKVWYNKDSVIFDPAVTIDQYDVSGQNGIHDETAQFFVDKLSGLPTMTFAGPADKYTLAPHLVGALGVVSQGAGPAYAKTITCPGLTGPVDFTANGWPLHALSMTDTGGSADDGKFLSNCIIQDLTLEWDFNAMGIARLAQMSGSWVGNKLNLEQTLTGTTVATTLTPYNNTESYSFSTFTVDSADWKALTFRKFTFSVNNNVTKDDSAAAGLPDQYNVKPEYTSTIILDYDATTEKVALDFQQGGLVVALFTSSTTATADGGLSISGVKGQIMSQPEMYEGEYKGVQLDIKWFANGAATPITIIQSDSQDWGYGT